MSWLSNFLTRKYTERYGRVDLQARNRKNIYRALRAYGYNNDVDIGTDAEDVVLQQLLAQGAGAGIMVDVGANVGKYSKKLLETFPQAQVHAFEPLRNTFVALEGLAQEHGARFTPVHAGVGAENGELELQFSDGAETHASFSNEATEVPYVENAQRELIDVVTLDSYFDGPLDGKTIDLIKIDVEGFEYEVLQGAQRVIAQHRPRVVQLEFNWHHMFRGHSLYMLSALLKGYDVFQLVPGGIAPRDPKDPLSNLFMFSNFVFIRSDLTSLFAPPVGR